MTELEWMEIFGDNLKDMLEYSKMTQRELADAAGLSESSVSDYIHKKKLPGVRALVNIAYVMDCTMDELIDFGDRII